ncbi:hypothetical protein RJ640_022651 [Escallonia rubra]|uniref:F-box domain-containing protein n=1 Tax=Escallonia rubra TaxID=112253 RepID=A0AA88QYW7_9ASTE|nr:hypothetical protein RJ640_022651 [Escallonia rubra]
MLVSVLSFLTMRDAAVTSLVSHRWRNLWEYFTSILTFDRAKEKRGGVDKNPMLLEGLRSKYIVNLTYLISLSAKYLMKRKMQTSLASKIQHIVNLTYLISLRAKYLMKRKVQTSLAHKVQKCTTTGGDGISQLPDEVLASILSFLTMRDAAVTSLVSHRWQHLWEYFTGILTFDRPEEEWGGVQENPKLLEGLRSNYISWVNQVCNSHKGPTIDGFVVRYDLDIEFSQHLDKWVDFAIGKKTKKLELVLQSFLGGHRASKRYTFSDKFFDRIKTPLGLSNIKYLRSLCFRIVNITGELIEHFLSHCPVLEQLCVQGSELLVDLKVTGSLKHLEIYQCFRVEKVEICAPDLVSLVFSNYRAGLHIKYAPKLVDTFIGWTLGAPISSVVNPVSSYLLQLETLTLDFVFSMGDSEAYTFFRFPKLHKLRNLTWKVDTNDSVSLLGLTSLIEASPSLQKFTLELSWSDHEFERELEKAIGCPHPCLQVVEVVGFVGRTIDVELVMYLLEHAGKLERIVLNPAFPWTIGTPLEFIEFKGTKAARECALQLKASVPRGAELVVL